MDNIFPGQRSKTDWLVINFTFVNLRRCLLFVTFVGVYKMVKSILHVAVTREVDFIVWRQGHVGAPVVELRGFALTRFLEMNSDDYLAQLAHDQLDYIGPRYQRYVVCTNVNEALRENLETIASVFEI